jgi:hypothetical protein
MKGRGILIGLGVLAVAIVAAVLWTAGNLNSLVRKGVERYGPRITGTDVRLAGVDLELREGRGTLRGLRIGNPDGFSNDDAIALGEITLDVDPGSLAKEPIVIETIRIAGPELLLELAKDGGVNLRSLQENVADYVPEASAKPPPRVAVRTLTVEGGKLAVDATAVGGKRSERDLGSFTLRDVGGAEGVPADRLGQEVLRALLRQALERGAAEELKRRAKDALGEAGGFLKGLTD